MTVFYQDQLAGGCHWSMLIRQGTVLQLTDIEGGANVGMLLYNPLDKLERYNAPDTLKAQHTFKLTKGHCLYSDMGRIFCSIIQDDLGWHDTIGGNLSDKALDSRWGRKTYQDFRNDWTISGEQAFLVELAKYGLNRRDMAANVNWFSRVAADENGDLSFDATHSPAGASVALRFEMDTLVLLHTCPHPLNAALAYPKKPVAYQLYQADPVQADDFCFNARPENQRGLQNNIIYHQCAHAGQTGGACHD